MTSTNETVRSHYDTLLAPVYAWMTGDLDAAQARARGEIERLAPFPDDAVGVDLGSGLGLHARALAELGHSSVWMVDTSAYLLEEALERTGGDGIHAVQSDLTAFGDHVPLPADTILCMGDTLTHLADRASVQLLLERVAASLRPGGVFLTTFRDYTVALEGVNRFLPVRSDADRVLTVFLEYGDETVVVHDLLHERQGDRWSLQASSYPKLRLDPAWIAGVLRDRDLAVEAGTSPGGLVQVVARRP